MLALTAGGCGGSSPPDGRRLFRSTGCGHCHTLAAAGAHGRNGPDLDTSERLTRAQIERQLVGASGDMPSYSGRLSKAERAAVAAFVYDATHAGAGGTSR